MMMRVRAVHLLILVGLAAPAPAALAGGVEDLTGVVDRGLVYCEALGALHPSVAPGLRSACLIDLAAKVADPRMCAGMQHDEAHACWARLALVTRDATLCHKLAPTFPAVQCLSDVAALNQAASTCEEAGRVATRCLKVYEEPAACPHKGDGAAVVRACTARVSAGDAATSPTMPKCRGAAACTAARALSTKAPGACDELEGLHRELCLLPLVRDHGDGELCSEMTSAPLAAACARLTIADAPRLWPRLTIPLQRFRIACAALHVEKRGAHCVADAVEAGDSRACTLEANADAVSRCRRSVAAPPRDAQVASLPPSWGFGADKITHGLCRSSETCAARLAVAVGDPSVCDEPGPHDRDVCRLDYVRDTGDGAGCANIASPGLAAACAALDAPASERAALAPWTDRHRKAIQSVEDATLLASALGTGRSPAEAAAVRELARRLRDPQRDARASTEALLAALADANHGLRANEPRQRRMRALLAASGERGLAMLRRRITDGPVHERPALIMALTDVAPPALDDLRAHLESTDWRDRAAAAAGIARVAAADPSERGLGRALGRALARAEHPLEIVAVALAIRSVGDGPARKALDERVRKTRAAGFGPPLLVEVRPTPRDGDIVELALSEKQVLTSDRGLRLLGLGPGARLGVLHGPHTVVFEGLDVDMGSFLPLLMRLRGPAQRAVVVTGSPASPPAWRAREDLSEIVAGGHTLRLSAGPDLPENEGEWEHPRYTVFDATGASSVRLGAFACQGLHVLGDVDGDDVPELSCKVTYDEGIVIRLVPQVSIMGTTWDGM